MTRYELYNLRAAECTAKAKETNDLMLVRFFINCAMGFKRKAASLTLEEAEKEVKA